ncbi:aldo/keto reductase [Aeromonas sp. A-5]|uniref:aldo/keto reductase n=1 Tax=Aeromonas ichthyocola TaxID=3367746 RepID=UPI0038D74733
MRLALGTVQFGLDYGISNHDGQVSDEELDAIIALARQAGIDTLDTAQAYGNAEQRLGQRDTTGFTLIDKLAPGLPLSDVQAAINNSLRLLGRKRLDGLLLHRSQDASPAMFELLTDLQQQGSIGKLGISVYSPESSIPGAQLAILWNWYNYLPICSINAFCALAGSTSWQKWGVKSMFARSFCRGCC